MRNGGARFKVKVLSFKIRFCNADSDAQLKPTTAHAQTLAVIASVENKKMTIKRTIILILSLTILFSCEDEQNIIRELTFNGKVKSGDTDQSLQNVKVKLDILGYDLLSQSSIRLLDSTFTDDSGNYSFKIKYSPTSKRIERYIVLPIKDFNSLCSSTSIVPLIQPFYVDVDTMNANTNDLIICQTGHIKLLATKLEPTKSDTLFYSQIIDSSFGDVYTSRQFITEPQTEKILKYFTKTVTKTTFKFKIKKEDGGITDSEQDISVQANTTVTLNIEY